jgi:hypothetical protein
MPKYSAVITKTVVYEQTVEVNAEDESDAMCKVSELFEDDNAMEILDEEDNWLKVDESVEWLEETVDVVDE